VPKNKIVEFFKKLFEKLDKKLEAKAKNKPCCPGKK